MGDHHAAGGHPGIVQFESEALEQHLHGIALALGQALEQCTAHQPTGASGASAFQDLLRAANQLPDTHIPGVANMRAELVADLQTWERQTRAVLQGFLAVNDSVSSTNVEIGSGDQAGGQNLKLT